MTGLPCSGKTTIVKDLQKDIPNLAMLDGDEVLESGFHQKTSQKEVLVVMNITKKWLIWQKLLLKHGVQAQFL